MKTKWFCGCKKEATSTIGYYSFDKNRDHEEFFSKKRLAKVRVCHKNKRHKIIKYTEID